MEQWRDQRHRGSEQVWIKLASLHVHMERNDAEDRSVCRWQIGRLRAVRQDFMREQSVSEHRRPREQLVRAAGTMELGRD